LELNFEFFQTADTTHRTIHSSGVYFTNIFRAAFCCEAFLHLIHFSARKVAQKLLLNVGEIDYRSLNDEHLGDFYQPCEPGIKANMGPRMPWQDIHVKIEGPAARDIMTNFVER
jgi:phosphatidylserine/phosphatidylglycerophosphate/cardiolipin synthase-like enzyme